ncbi:MAG: helix-turn-helix domain-containing protein [Planctomycetes bacterium]|nr:helix-turn-helix domain-containing protein [Planctomycetota bacterium]
MIRVQLPAAEADRLDALFRSTDDPAFRVSLQIVLMAHRGRARQDIAADRGVHRKTVTRWVNAYRADGLDGLRPKKAKGTPGHIPEGLADEIKRWGIEGPAKPGLDRANGTHAELADHPKKVKGIRPSRSAVPRFCSGIGIRLYRPTYRHDRGDPVEQSKAKADLADLGNGRRPANSCC